MSDIADAARQEAVNLAFELAKAGIAKWMGRSLRADEEAQLLADLREKEAERRIKTTDEILGNGEDPEGEPV